MGVPVADIAYRQNRTVRGLGRLRISLSPSAGSIRAVACISALFLRVAK